MKNTASSTICKISTFPWKNSMVAAKSPKKNPPKNTAPVDDNDIFSLIGKSEQIEEAAIAMQAMSHPLRIKILCLLSSGEMMVQDIVEAVGTTQSNISQHLGILKATGIIEAHKRGTKMFYCIADKRIVKMMALTREMFCSV